MAENDADRIAQLEARVEQLETQITTMSQNAGGPQVIPANAPVNPPPATAGGVPVAPQGQQLTGENVPRDENGLPTVGQGNEENLTAPVIAPGNPDGAQTQPVQQPAPQAATPDQPQNYPAQTQPATTQAQTDPNQTQAVNQPAQAQPTNQPAVQPATGPGTGQSVDYSNDDVAQNAAEAADPNAAGPENQATVTRDQLEEMTKEELSDTYGVSASQLKDEMIDEILENQQDRQNQQNQ